MRSIHPAFRNIADTETAEVFSEPLMRDDEFQMYYDGCFEDIYRPLGGIAAVGAAHIGDDKDITFKFALHAKNNQPYATVRAFANGYHNTVSDARNKALGDPYAVYNSVQARRTLVEIASRYRFKTIAAFLLFSIEEVDTHTGMLIMPRNVMTEVGAVLSQLDASSRPNSNRFSHQDMKKLGFLTGLVQLPSLAKAKEAVDSHPVVGGFLNLERGPRRAKLRTEPI